MKNIYLSAFFMFIIIHNIFSQEVKINYAMIAMWEGGTTDVFL